VDFVVIFEEATPRKLIAALLPDVLVKARTGEAKLSAAKSGSRRRKVLSLPLEPGYSTTQFLKRFARPWRNQSRAHHQAIRFCQLPIPRNRRVTNASTAITELLGGVARYPAVDDALESLRRGVPAKTLPD